jgi:hypothetical protein
MPTPASCIDGVEVSTNGGHYAAVGMRTAPFPSAGKRDVVEDVQATRGFGIVTHPIPGKRSCGAPGKPRSMRLNG